MPPVLHDDSGGAESGRCGYCFSMRPSPASIPFCSKACLAKAEDYECEAAASRQLLPNKVTPTIKLAARVLRRIHPAALSSPHPFNTLVSNLDGMSSSLKSTLSEMAALTLRYYLLTTASSSLPSPPTLADAVAVLARINQNGYTIADSELQPLGIGIFLKVRGAVPLCAAPQNYLTTTTLL